MIKQALTTLVAGVFAASLCVMPAFADSVPTAPADNSTRMYTVDIYGGNNGVVNGANPYTVSIAAGDTLSFDDIAVTVNADVAGKYYVKGLRDASVNNAYTRDYVVEPTGVISLGENTYGLSGSMKVTEDTDLVVAYGIKSQRVNYTVRYIDAAGNEIAQSDTFVGDVGDHPAPVAKYIEGYLPRMTSIAMPALKGGNETNEITFDYVKLPTNYRVIYENEVITIITPEGEEITVTPVTPQAVEDAGGDIPIVTAAGEEIIDENGNPLAAPIDEVTLEDDANPLANAKAAMGDTEGAAHAASILGWLLPLLAGIVIAGLIVFFALLIHQKRKDNEQRSTSK